MVTDLDLVYKDAAGMAVATSDSVCRRPDCRHLRRENLLLQSVNVNLRKQLAIAQQVSTELWYKLITEKYIALQTTNCVFYGVKEVAKQGQ